MTKGCAAVVYTDGVTDALDSTEEPFGEQRLLDCCRDVPKGATREEIGTFVLERINEWASGVEQFDDTTILVLAVE
jgi:serine phosphatase RsbU (regulator of sigma subunit)